MDYVCKVVGELSIEEKDFQLKMSFNEIVDLNQEDFKVSPRLREALRNREIEVYTPTLHQKARRLNRNMRRMPLVQEKIIPLKQAVEEKHINDNLINNSELNELKSILEGISSKMSGVVSRLDLLVTKVIDSNTQLNANFNRFFNERQNVQVVYDNPKLDSLLDKVINTQDKFNNFIEDQNRIHIANSHKMPEPQDIKEDKLDKLLSSVEKLLSEGIKIDGKILNTQNTNGKAYSKINVESQVHIKDEDIPLYVPKIDTASISNKNIVTEALESEGTDSILEKLKKLK